MNGTLLQSGGKGLQTGRINKSRLQASVCENEGAPATHSSTSVGPACSWLKSQPLQPSEEDLAGGGRPDNLDGLCEVGPHPASFVNGLSSRNIPTFTLHFGPPLSSQKPPRVLVCPCLDRFSRGPSVMQTPAPQPGSEEFQGERPPPEFPREPQLSPGSSAVSQPAFCTQHQVCSEAPRKHLMNRRRI